ncbi:hypothetical protein JCM4814A_52840 [Streptomyces phaeofaciens JCM 4814]|uniref:Uncharacterized protein n=1 Tax=Streptomyces phaeofaciens TaxID=68254 RepID=A0A918M1X6_9ACTN|nr:hypothetical protein [Streptomyces phaeofaciens]GGU01075.1 hypothetical protein GCM10010226_92200 [Streptomyces phaeofaciens]
MTFTPWFAALGTIDRVPFTKAADRYTACAPDGLADTNSDCFGGDLEEVLVHHGPVHHTGDLVIGSAAGLGSLTRRDAGRRGRHDRCGVPVREPMLLFGSPPAHPHDPELQVDLTGMDQAGLVLPELLHASGHQADRAKIRAALLDGRPVLRTSGG